MVEKKLTDDH